MKDILTILSKSIQDEKDLDDLLAQFVESHGINDYMFLMMLAKSVVKVEKRLQESDPSMDWEKFFRAFYAMDSLEQDEDSQEEYQKLNDLIGKKIKEFLLEYFEEENLQDEN